MESQQDNVDRLLSEFTARAAPLGVDVQRVATSTDAIERIAALATELAVDQVLVTDELATAAPHLMELLGKQGIVVTQPGDPASTRDAPLGLSLAQLAIAETGSVLLAEPSLEDRGVGLLVVTQFVIVPTSLLVPSLNEAAPVLRSIAGRGGYATLVTGPSRTADIERVLTVGVQGPARLAVLFIDDLE